ncbi:hypothetical protein [Enterobacter cloacae complex sp. 418I7]|uniref:hypothetical protein n=1 Tax=Enterobacter cloacae complex sp. 418I7 TaxID=3395839 RepID=UPI003CF3C8D7
MGERKNLKELLEKKVEHNKKALSAKEGETPLFREEGFNIDPFEHEDLVKAQSDLYWKYIFSIEKSKSKIRINKTGKASLFDKIKIVDYGDAIDVFTLDYTDIKAITNTESIVYSKFDSELLSNEHLENKTKEVSYYTSISKELADNKPYLKRNIENFLDLIFINYFNEDKSHVVYVKNTFDSLLHNINNKDELRRFIYKAIISESAFRKLNIKISFLHEDSDFVWSVYEEIIQDMKVTRRKVNKGNVYFSDKEKEVENLKLSLLLKHLNRIKDRYENS